MIDFVALAEGLIMLYPLQRDVFFLYFTQLLRHPPIHYTMQVVDLLDGKCLISRPDRKKETFLVLAKFLAYGR
jgi:hypothetical protein